MSRFISVSEMIQNRAIVLWNTNRNLYSILQMVPFSIALNDPSPDFKVTPSFDAEYFRNGAR